MRQLRRLRLADPTMAAAEARRLDPGNSPRSAWPLHVIAWIVPILERKHLVPCPWRHEGWRFGNGCEFWADERVSAFKREPVRRFYGRRFLTATEPGDHIIVTRSDRCFRTMMDFVQTFKAMEGRGVHLHILDAPGDPGTANGRAMLQMLCVFAEWESRVKSERVKAAMVILRQQGKHTGGKAPWGYKVVGPRSNPQKGVKGNRRIEPDWEERALMLEIVRFRDVERILCWETIAVRMRQIQRDARRAGIDNPALFRREWSSESCQRAYAAFWTVLVEKEGASWIANPIVKRLVDLRLAQG